MNYTKKERPTRGEPIRIPDFMLSPRERKRKKKKRDLAESISYYGIVSLVICFVWFFLYQDMNWKIAFIGMAVSAVLTVLIVKWRRSHGFGGDESDMDRRV